jgi:Flp pilus assembly protein TadB
VALGDGNRCARCMATAPVFERTGRYVCSACGESRQRYAQTIVTSEAELLQAFEISTPMPLLRPALLILGVLCLLGVGARAGLPLWMLAAVGVLGLGAALQVAWSGRLLRRRARGRRRYEIEQRIIGLAFCNDGLLSAGLVSDTLRISVREAQELLGELVRAGRARAEPSVDGPDIIYHFGEAKRTRGIRRSQIS